MNSCVSACMVDINNLLQKAGLLFDITLCIGIPVILIILCELLPISSVAFSLMSE